MSKGTVQEVVEAEVLPLLVILPQKRFGIRWTFFSTARRLQQNVMYVIRDWVGSPCLNVMIVVYGMFPCVSSLILNLIF